MLAYAYIYTLSEYFVIVSLLLDCLLFNLLNINSQNLAASPYHVVICTLALDDWVVKFGIERG